MFAPATLGVYLIHENMFIKQLIWSIVFASSEPSGLFYKAVVATISVALLYMGLLVVSHLFDKYIVKPISDHAFARFSV